MIYCTLFCSPVTLPEVDNPVGPKVSTSEHASEDKPTCNKQESNSGLRIPDMTTVFFKKTFEELIREVSQLLDDLLV